MATTQEQLTETQGQLDSTHRLQSKPGLDRNRPRWLRAWRAVWLGATSGPLVGRGGRRLELNIWTNSSVLHLVGRHPSRAIELGLDPLAAHFFDNIGNTNPQHTDRHGVIASPIIYGQFDLIGLVNIEFVQLVGPPLGPRRFCASLEDILDLDHNKGLGSSAEASSGRVVHVCDSMDTNGQTTSQWFTLTRNIQTVI
jgi:hypothetical protein